MTHPKLRAVALGAYLIAGCQEASSQQAPETTKEPSARATIEDGGVDGEGRDARPAAMANDASSEFVPDASMPSVPTKPPADWVPVFVATGYAGRSTVSCDDGQTWIENRSDDANVRCFDPTDCDHRKDNNTGLVYKDGWFIATFGWGSPGTIRRTQDGKTWTTTLTGTQAHGSTFAGLCTGGSLVLAGARVGRVSSDLGATWQDMGDTMLGDIYNVRAGGFVNYDGGRFVLSAADGARRATRVSKDGGKTWVAPSSLPAECGDPTSIVSFQNALLMAIGDGMICRSPDGGSTWTSKDLIEVDGGFHTKFVVTEKEVLIWGYHETDGRVVLRSSDGLNFTRQKTSGAHVGAVGYSTQSGTFVASNEDWNGWYEDQKFFRSQDGVRWEELPKSSFVGSHPISHIAFGYVPPNSVCK